MSNDDELRSRLSPEPYSLTPPPGLFDQVARTAQKRRRGRMAAAVLSTVVAAVGFAGVSSALVGRILDKDRKAQVANPGPTSPPSQRPTLPTTRPTPSSLPVPTAPPRVRPDDGTDVQDLTWISTETGWALGFVLDCAHAGGDKSVPSCYTVLHTVDGGQTWDKIATQPAASHNSYERNELRFANKTTGYLVLDGKLLLSTDGGRTWRPGGLTGVSAVEAARSGAVALVNESAGDLLCSPCHVLHAPLGSAIWKKTLDLPYDAAELRRSGDTVFATTFSNPAGGADDKSAQLHVSRDGGLTWTRRVDPCSDVHIMGHYVPFATSFEIAGPAVLASCEAMTFDSTQHDFVILSSDGGKTFGEWHDTPCGYSRYSIGSERTIGCAYEDGVHVSQDGGVTWSLTLPAAGRAGADGCGFQNSMVGRCVRGVTVFTTRDAGRTWKARDVSAA